MLLFISESRFRYNRFGTTGNVHPRAKCRVDSAIYTPSRESRQCTGSQAKTSCSSVHQSSAAMRHAPRDVATAETDSVSPSSASQPIGRHTPALGVSPGPRPAPQPIPLAAARPCRDGPVWPARRYRALDSRLPPLGLAPLRPTSPLRPASKRPKNPMLQYPVTALRKESPSPPRRPNFLNNRKLQRPLVPRLPVAPSIAVRSIRRRRYARAWQRIWRR